MTMRGTERKAATLIEVLVAIFVMAIGLLALLVLFPLGALSMGRAIQDEYAANTVANADAVAKIWNVRRDPNVVTSYVNPLFALSQPPNPLIPEAAADEPGYPVLIDPPGVYTAGALFNVSNWVGGTPGLIPRRNVSFVANDRAALRWFTFLDTLLYNDSGQASIIVPASAGPPATLNQLERDIRYSYAYLCRRPRSADPATTDMAVVVYNKRPLTLSIANSDLYETVYGIGAPGTQALFDPANNIIRVTHTGVPPNVRKGDWVLDATPFIIFPEPAKAPPLRTSWVRHAFFYRVVGITEVNANQVDLEVQTPIRTQPTAWSALPPPASAPTNGPAPWAWSGTLIVMEGVAEVFERGTGQRP
jgi:hypothetical protein